jgi:ribosomal protein L18
MAIVTRQTPSRFHVAVKGAARAAQVIPVHSAHTRSMIAQASRVPRLAKLNTNLQTKNISAAAARGKAAAKR